MKSSKISLLINAPWIVALDNEDIARDASMVRSHIHTINVKKRLWTSYLTIVSLRGGGKLPLLNLIINIVRTLSLIFLFFLKEKREIKISIQT